MWNDEISDWELPPTTHHSVCLGFESEDKLSNWEIEILNELGVLWEEGRPRYLKGEVKTELPEGAIQMVDCEEIFDEEADQTSVSETWVCGPENWYELAKHAPLIKCLAEHARSELRDLVRFNPHNQWEETFKRYIQKPSLLDSFCEITEAHVAAATEYAIAFAMADCDFPEYAKHLRKARRLLEHCGVTYEDMMRATYD